MDPVFFADPPDPDFKNPHPDPSVFYFNISHNLMGSKLCSLIRFWKILTKKERVESDKSTQNKVFYLNLVFAVFFMDLDPDPENKSDPEPAKRN